MNVPHFRKFAFISDEEPTPEQIALAQEQKIALTTINAQNFTVKPEEIDGSPDGPFEGVIVKHPAVALRLCSDFVVGVFETENLTANSPPIALHLYDVLPW